MIADAERHTATLVARFATGERAAQKLASLIDERFPSAHAAVSLVDMGRGSWQVAIHFRGAPEAKAVRALVAAAAGRAVAKALTFERVAAKDWVAASLAGLEPVEAGRFVVHGAHDRDRIPCNRIGIEIEASLAFGTGHHGTTRGCLLALDGICKALTSPSARGRHPSLPRKRGKVRGTPSRLRDGDPGERVCRARRPPFRGRNLQVLDLGTGSGVLAIAAARALRRRVLATDVDVEAVRVARANTRLNGVAPLIEIVRANGVAKQVRARAPFDLVCANILLAPLQRFAATLTARVARGGRIVLSGLLASQANAALAAYRPLPLERRIDLDGWTTLVLKRPLRPRRSCSR